MYLKSPERSSWVVRRLARALLTIADQERPPLALAALTITPTWSNFALGLKIKVRSSKNAKAQTRKK